MAQTLKLAAQYRKAIYAALVAFFGALGTALTDGGVTGVEWTTIALATLLAAGGTAGITNAPRPARSRRTNARRGRDDGLPGGVKGPDGP